MLFRYLLAISLFTGSIHAGPVPSKLASITNAAATYFQNGDYKQSEEALKQGMQTAYSAASPSDRVLALNALGMALRAQGKMTESEQTYVRARSETEAPPEAIALVDYNYGRLCLDLGRVSQAETLASEALRFRLNSPSTPGQIAEAENLLGLIYQNLSRPGEAMDLFEKALNRSQGTPAAAESLINLASIYRKRGDLAKARTSFSLAVDLSRPLVEKPEILAAALNGLGLVAQETGDSKDAEAFYTEALKAWREPRGVPRVGYTATLSNLGVLKETGHHFKEAHTLYQEALTRDRQTYGTASPITGFDMVRLGSLLCRTGEETSGKAFLQQAAEQNYDPKAPSPVTAIAQGNLGLVAFRHQDWPEAERLLGSAMATLQQTTSPTDTRRAAFLGAYAETLKRTGKFAESEEMSAQLANVQYHSAMHAR